MTAYTFTFSGTEEQLLAGAIENGYTGFKPIDSNVLLIPGEMPEPEPETIDEFMCRIFMSVSPTEFIRIATIGLQMKKGTENYDAQAMTDAMINLISISPIVE